MRELGDVVELLDLDIEVIVRKSGTMGKDLAGEYNLYSRVIFLRSEIIPYWFATLITLLHEYGHHKHRRVILAFIALVTLSNLSSCLYGLMYSSLLSNTLLILIGMISVVTVVYLKVRYFEILADKFMIKHIPDNLLLLISDLEFVEIAEGLETHKKSVPKTLRELHKNLQEYYPHLLG